MFLAKFFPTSYLNNKATTKELKNENAQFPSIKSQQPDTIFSQEIAMVEFSGSKRTFCLFLTKLLLTFEIIKTKFLQAAEML